MYTYPFSRTRVRISCTFAMCWGSVVRMKKSLRRPQPRRQRTEALRVAIRQLLGLDAQRVRRVGHRLPVLVGARQEEHLLPALAVVAREHVGGDRRVRVPEVGGRVDVVDRGGYVEGGHGRPGYWLAPSLQSLGVEGPTTSTTSPFGGRSR